MYKTVEQEGGWVSGGLPTTACYQIRNALEP